MSFLNSIASLHIFLFLLPSILCKPCDFPAIFALGDSNSDTGGFSAAFGPLGSPYGDTFFHMPSGRFSDGRLIIDFIAENLGLPYLSSYLDSLGANFSHGANFATSLSTIIPQNITLAQGGYSPFSLDIQAMQFSQFQSRSQFILRKGGMLKSLMPMKDYFSRALYIIDIGQNDLTALYFSNSSAEQYIHDAMKAFSKTIKSLYKNGGRYFWIHNTGPLGCLPYVLRQVPGDQKLDSVGCAVVFNELAKKFNRMLNETVAQLQKQFPVAAFTYVDIYSAKYLLISHATKFGFRKPLMACCGHGGGAYNYDPKARCGTSVNVHGNEVLIGKSCMDSSKRVSWDGAHFTEAANKWVFDQIVNGHFSYPSNSLNMACYNHNHKSF
ncbi:GDSL lipase/esterase protein [Dioscorea alata]|uniref:GDSL lipase/esterase protein n=1 Tax=Dioscorea alata TaxID=55571 RepID=A0ACB7VAL7_DIOAL|nr:GDSL lipase/esterase protein [Dioscorea alata]